MKQSKPKSRKRKPPAFTWVDALEYLCDQAGLVDEAFAAFCAHAPASLRRQCAQLARDVANHIAEVNKLAAHIERIAARRYEPRRHQPRNSNSPDPGHLVTVDRALAWRVRAGLIAAGPPLTTDSKSPPGGNLGGLFDLLAEIKCPH